MRRRSFIAAAVGPVLAWSCAGYGQRSQLPTIGVLRVNRPGAGETFAEPFRHDMGELGWENGRNVRFIFRWAEVSNERLPALAQELVDAPADVIIAFGEPASA